MSQRQLSPEEIATLRALHAERVFTPAGIGVWFGLAVEDVLRTLDVSTAPAPSWQSREVVDSEVVRDLQRPRTGPPINVSELDVAPEHAGAAAMGRAFAAAVERGYVFSDMHTGNFLFDGEYGVISDIGENVGRDNPVDAVASQLILLEPSWGHLFAPFARGCFLHLQGVWGWNSPSALVSLRTALSISDSTSMVQGSSSIVLDCVEKGEWAPSIERPDQWVAAAAALCLLGHELHSRTLSALRALALRSAPPLESAEAVWLAALLRTLQNRLDARSLFLEATGTCRENDATSTRGRIDFLIVGHMYRLLRRSSRHISGVQAASAQLMHLLLQLHLKSISLEQAELELNSLAPGPLDISDAAQVRLALGYTNTAAISDLDTFERSLRRLQDGASLSPLWNLAWRTLRSVRRFEEAVANCFASEDYYQTSPELRDLLGTHRRAVALIATALQEVGSRGDWSPWGSAERAAPNRHSELAWIETGLKLLSAESYGMIRDHWQTLSEKVNLKMDPLRILDGSMTVDLSPIHFSELDTAWGAQIPLIVPQVSQCFAWHLPQDDRESVNTPWPVPEDLLLNPTLVDEPKFTESEALSEFGQLLFASITENNFPDHKLKISAMREDGTQMRSFRAGSLLFFTFNLSQSDTARSFCDRVREPVRRPPPEMASFAASQRILAHGVHRITVRSSIRSDHSSLLDVGWYLAVIELP